MCALCKLVELIIHQLHFLQISNFLRFRSNMRSNITGYKPQELNENNFCRLARFHKLFVLPESQTRPILLGHPEFQAFITSHGPAENLEKIPIKDGAYYCYCAFVLRISRHSDFLSPMLTNTGIFLRGLKLSGESRS